MQRLRTILAITSVRLSIIYSLIFGVVAIILVFYLTSSTVNLLRRQIQNSINAEIVELNAGYDRDGINGLVLMLERAAAAPGANIYVLTEASGQIIAANIRNIESGVISSTGWTQRPFAYTRYDDGGRREYRAVARIVKLPNGMRMLVGRDLGEPERFRDVIGRAMFLALGFMLLVGIATWLLVGRRALKRLDLVAKSTERIMAGDRTERLPITGGGDEFDRLSSRLNEMLDRIFKLDEGLKQVSDNIAHDLKTPLTRLRNKADRAVAKADDPEHARAALNEMIGDTDQIIKTFNALLMISRVESGSAAAELRELDLSALAEDVAELYGPVAEEAGFAVTIEIEPGLKVRGNRELLSQALANLCDNALKYARPPEDEQSGEESDAKPDAKSAKGKAGKKGKKPVLEIRAAREDGHVRLSVRDNGPGIPVEAHEKVTERFTRLEESRSLPGNGLGLSLVRAVAQLHGGVLEFADAGPGLKADVVLPVAEPV